MASFLAYKMPTFSVDLSWLDVKLVLEDIPSSLLYLGLLPERILKFLSLDIKEPDLPFFPSVASSPLFKLSTELGAEAALAFVGRELELFEIAEGFEVRGGGSV